MAFVTVSGDPGCREVELARAVAERLEWELVTEPDLPKMGEGHVVVCGVGVELLARDLSGMLRVHLIAPERIRLDSVIEDYGLSRAKAKVRLREIEGERALVRKRRFRQKMSRPTDFDLALNAEKLSLAEMVDLVEAAVMSQGLFDSGTLAVPESNIEPKDVGGHFGRHFGHPSEQVFANVLDFYGIAWDYEPRSFPLQWD